MKRRRIHSCFAQLSLYSLHLSHVLFNTLRLLDKKTVASSQPHPDTTFSLCSSDVPADMCAMLCAVLVLLGFPLANMFVLHPSSDAPAAKAHRCRGELEIRKILLEFLNLQQEPRVSVSGMKHLRDQWKATLKTTVQSTAVNTTFSEDSGNTTQQQCCKYSSQIFIKDLGWDRWIVYPETFTFSQCRSCGLNHCSEIRRSSAQCCEPTAHDIIPFVYVDDWGSLVVSSVSMASECGCDPGEEPQDPEVMSPS